MINTYNESSLHKTLKKMYSLDDGSRTEVEQNGHIYDILKKDGTVVEIQTQNLGKLLSKLQDSIEKGHKVTVVHPLVIRKKITLINQFGTKISERKSPKINSIYNIFNELTGLYPILLNKNFKLKVLCVNITEERIRTEKPVQSANKKRRFKRNWIKKDKKLEEIISEKTFDSAADYLALLPEDLPDEFTTKDLQKKLKENKDLPVSAAKQANLIAWVLQKMELIERTGTKDRFRTYRIKQTFQNPESYGFFKPN